jgi:hypothetical protein
MTPDKKRVFVDSKEDMPKVEHWAIFRFESISIPGDERSRQAPGHGYPAHNEAVVKYEAYFDKAEWEAALLAIESTAFSKPSYMAARIIPANVQVKLKIDVNEA